MTTIGRGLHGLPSFEEFSLKDNLGLLELYNVRVRGRCRSLIGCRKEGHARMETVIGEEGGKCRGRVFRIIVAEFSQWEEAGPVGLLIVAVDSKILLQDRIEALRLVVRLRMKSR